jgi:hypothetical protein
VLRSVNDFILVIDSERDKGAPPAQLKQALRLVFFFRNFDCTRFATLTPTYTGYADRSNRKRPDEKCA